MRKAEFDQFAEEYATMHANNISASGEAPPFFARYKIADVIEELKSRGVEGNAVLDFGSGIGNSIPFFAELMPDARLVCTDISRRSLDISQQRFPDVTAEYTEITEEKLPFADEEFDLVFSACVFHHIPHAEHAHWLSELRRVTRKGGALLIFEHNPLNPLTVSAVNQCPFDEHAVLICACNFSRRLKDTGWSEVRTAYRIFFPNFLAFARPLEKWLRWLPLGAQYFVSARRNA
jgi:ubiquinone/menaquinone biosynthesis C-methylase UbiE